MPASLRLVARSARTLSIAVITLSSLVLPASRAGAQPPSLEGTWWVRVVLLTSCTGGTPLPPFWSQLTFARGGTLTGTTMSPAFAPGQRGPDHGTWSKAEGPFGYAASSAAFLNFATPPSPGGPGFQTGFQRIDQSITLAGPDQFTSTAVVSFFDTTVTVYRRGCAIADGYRFR